MPPSINHDHYNHHLTMLPFQNPNLYRLTTTVGSPAESRSHPHSSSPISLEIRLFYVRVAPCAADSVPETLTLRFLTDEVGVALDINGCRLSTSSILRRDRVDRDSSEVTYVSTDIVRLTGGIEFEVFELGQLLLRGSVEKSESNWSMDCYRAASVNGGGVSPSAFIQPKIGISSPSIEVYITGMCADMPVILTKMMTVSPRRKPPRHCTLDAIPEVDDEVEKEIKIGNHLISRRKLQLTESADEYDMEGKIAHRWYPEEVYEGEDGQLTWFNAGVRVGVGIGLGMCLGIGIGVGLLMSSYQTTTRNLKRRFL